MLGDVYVLFESVRWRAYINTNPLKYSMGSAKKIEVIFIFFFNFWETG